jgi:cytochrome c oxidase assembly protein subunit 15
MEPFRRLALASTLATLALVTLGGLVRATKSGLGCGTDWPHCSGKLLPALETRAVAIEFSHRVAASVVVVLLGALAVMAWRRLRATPLMWGAFAAFGLVLFQAVLGAVVVKLELAAVSVVLHLVTAMALLAVLVYVTAAASGAAGASFEPDGAAARAGALGAGAVLVLLAVGSYVSGTPGAGLAFGDWPLMGGRLVPSIEVEAAALHFVHRALAAVVGVAVAVACLQVIRRRTELPLQARLARVALGAFALEVVVGAANVWTELNAAVVTVHLFLGAVVWTALVTLAVVSRPLPDAAGERLTRSSPAFDSAR